MDPANDSALNSAKQEPEETSEIIISNLLESDGSEEGELEGENVSEFKLLEEAEPKNGNINYLLFSCDCGARFERESALRSHQIRGRREGMIKYKCSVGGCNRTFSCRKQKYDHVEVYHPNQPQILKCSECTFIAITSRGLKIHSSIHKPKLKEKHRCDQCLRSFETVILLSNHKDINHKHACSQCGLDFGTRKDFREHQSQMGNFKCLLCDKEFECEYAKSQHLERDHKEGIDHRAQLATSQHKESSKLETFDVEVKFQCDHCGLTFINRQKLRFHMLDHFKFPLSCDGCETRFFLMEHLINHRKNYSGNFRCKKQSCLEMCNKVFECKRALNIHIGKDHEETWKCPECPEIFQTRNKRQVHRNEQHKEKFQCDLCDLSFFRKRILKFHKWRFHKMYITEKFSCDKCEKKFKTLNDLRKHEILAHPILQAKKKYKPRLHSNQNPQFSFVSLDSTGSIVSKQEQEESSTVTEIWSEKHDFTHHSMVTLNQQEISSDTNHRFDTKKSVAVYQEQEKSSTKNDPVRPYVKRNRYVCRECGRESADRMALKRHQRRWSRFTCDICDQEFQCKFALFQHIQQDHENESKCRKCPFVGKNLKSLRWHCNIRHKAQALALQTSLEMPETHDKHACSKCGLEFGTRKGFREHQLLMGNFKCLFCNEEFECEYARSQHLERDHKEDIKHRGQLDSLQQKESSKLETFDFEVKFECDHCGLSFDKRRKLVLHMLDHLKFAFTCDDCGARFSELKNLESHRKVYSGKFKCVRMNCDKVFKCKRALNIHMRKDHEKIWKCPECPKTFKARKHLRLHRDKQHNKKFQCDICDLSFLKGKVLKSHKWKFHQNDMDISKFSCAECGNKFRTRENLRKHKVQTDHQIFRKQSRSSKNSNQSFVDSKQIPEKSKTVTETLTSFEDHMEELAGYSIKKEPQDTFPDVEIYSNVASNKQEKSSEINLGLETAVQHEQEESPSVTETLDMNIHVKEEPEVCYVLKLPSEEEDL